MKVADTFAYFSAKTPILVTEGVNKILFDGDRNEMPEELEELTATRFEFLFNERKFWVAVEAQKSKEEKQSPAEKKETPYAKNCGNCAFFDAKNFYCRIDRETKKDPAHKVCCAYSKHPGKVDENDTKYQFEIVARRAFLAPPPWMEEKKAGDIRCADCAWYVKEKGRCWGGVTKECNDDTVCGLGMKRSDYE